MKHLDDKDTSVYSLNNRTKGAAVVAWNFADPTPRGTVLWATPEVTRTLEELGGHAEDLWAYHGERPPAIATGVYRWEGVMEVSDSTYDSDLELTGSWRLVVEVTEEGDLENM